MLALVLPLWCTGRLIPLATLSFLEVPVSILDTSHVRPTSTDSPLNDVGVWEAFRRANSPVWAAERATRCAAIRNELDEQIVRPRTAEDALADVKRFKAMLSVPAVIASGPWTQDVERKLAGARAELGRFRRAGAR